MRFSLNAVYTWGWIGVLLASPVFAADPLLETVAVEADAELSVHPDRAVISVGVETLEKNANASTSKNAQVVAQAEKILRERFKLEEEDVRTREYRVVAEYSYSASKREFLGFRTTNVLAITVKQIEKLGVLLDALSGVGINAIQGIEFDSTRRTELGLEALQQAMELARKKADTIAKSSGRGIKRLIRAEDSRYWQQDNPDTMPQVKMAVEASGGQGTFIAAGTMKVSARVRAVFLLQ